MSRAIADVLAERERQQTVEGYTTAHDDAHEQAELALAALCLIDHAAFCGLRRVPPCSPDEYQHTVPDPAWPWDMEHWKPKGPRRDLVVAGALIIAEIERLDRAIYDEPVAEQKP